MEVQEAEKTHQQRQGKAAPDSAEIDKATGVGAPRPKTEGPIPIALAVRRVLDRMARSVRIKPPSA